MRNHMILVCVLLSFLGIHRTTAVYAEDFPGPYCETSRSGCCNNRQDGCAVPISTTLCYCDEFCDRSVNGDCCPDYQSFCLNIYPPPAETKKCEHRGKKFTPFDPPIKDNCNLCTCLGNNATVSCERDTCLIDDRLIDEINYGSRSSWRAANYSVFWGEKLSRGNALRLGTFEPIYKVKQMTRLSNKQDNIPKFFDSYQHWPNLITDIRDQGWCGSSWAVSTATVASDRFSIASKGREAVAPEGLAPQQLLSCVRRQRGCAGGHLDTAWNYFRSVGLVNEDCYPYIAAANRCKVNRRDNLITSGCQRRSNSPRDDFYRMGPAYSLNNETDIMIEIMNNGPVQATMHVYRDFFSYQSGIYRLSVPKNGADRHGFHSVRLLGWGEERDGYSTTKYWIAANSWGTWWGERGLFRIIRGVNECEIESYVLGSRANVHTKIRAANALRRNYS